MKSEYLKQLFSAGLLLILVVSCGQFEEAEDQSVKAFELDQVTLLDGPFKRATELNRESLLQYEPDRFLANFRNEAGLEPKAENYGGWEDQSLAGHSLGHHLSACALMYLTSGDERFLNRAKYIVDELAIVQEADGDGYLGAFPNGKKIFEEEVAKGDIRAQSFDLNGIWAPFYTHHKVLGGLRDAYRLLGIEKALDVEKRFADWIGTIVEPLNDEEVQLMLNCEHGGMNEMLVDLYTDTKDERYMNMSYIFHHKVVLDSLANHNDILPGIHGNTQIPKLIGLAKRYEVNGDQEDYEAATFFWDRVVNHHSYVTGGHGNHEYFGEPDELNFRLSAGTTETCNVYNMLKLSNILFQWKPTAEVADFYERALFNHILASQHPENGRVIYNLSLEMGGRKHYQNPYGFTCCVGSGMETHSKYGGIIYYHNEDQFLVSQFIASEVDWVQKGIKIRQETNFPEEQNTTIIIESQSPQRFDLKVRHPYWAEEGITVKVNGKTQNVNSSPGSFASLDRVWESGDKVEVELPFTIHTAPMPDNPNRLAIMNGPLVLASDLGPEDDSNATNPDYVPVFLTEENDPVQWLKPTNEPNTFQMDNVGSPRNVTFKPFYTTHERRYSVYHDKFNEQELEDFKNGLVAEKEKKKRLEEMTYDHFLPTQGKEDEEHKFEGDSVYVERFRDKRAHVASRGGRFSFEMKVMKGQPMALVAEYWGGYTGSKTFDIVVNGERVATDNISGKKDGHFIDVQYDIPESITENVSTIKVEFLPHVGHRAGPLFGMRTIKR